MKTLKQTFNIVALSAGLIALAPGAVSAENNCCYDPCESRCWDFGSFEFGVDFLYWKPCVSDVDFVGIQTKDNDPYFRYKIRSIDTDWEPGVRASLKIPSCTCDWDVEASYTYIESRNTESRKVKPADGDMYQVNTHPAVAFPRNDLAKGSWNAEYQEWELLFSYNLHNSNCHRLSGFFGVAGIEFDQKLKIRLAFENGDELVDNHWRGDYWGVGFRAGSDYQYSFSDCISFFTRAHASILAGEPKNVKQNFKHTFEGQTIDSLRTSDDNRCQIVPGYNIAAGFAYNTSYCDTEWSLRVGYQFLQWFNLPRHRTYYGSGGNILDQAGVVLSTSSASTGRSLGMHGLTAGISVAF